MIRKWNHETDSGAIHAMGNGDVITDLVDTEVNCFLRRVEVAEERTMILHIDPIFSLVESESKDKTLVFEAKNGVHFFVYPVALHPRRYMKVSESVTVTRLEEGVYQLTFGKETGSLYLSDSPASIEAEEASEFALSMKRVTAYWQEFLSQIKPFPGRISATVRMSSS